MSSTFRKKHINYNLLIYIEIYIWFIVKRLCQIHLYSNIFCPLVGRFFQSTIKENFYTYFIFSKSWVSPSWAEKTNNYRVCVNIFRYNIHSKDIQQYLYNWLSTPLRNTNCWRKWRCWELISVIDSFCYCFVISAFTFIHLKKLILCITKIQTH